jgi:hypothetical protein
MGRLEILGTDCAARVGVAGGFVNVFTSIDDDWSYHSTLGSVGTGREVAADEDFTRGGVKTTGSWVLLVVLSFVEDSTVVTVDLA